MPRGSGGMGGALRLGFASGQDGVPSPLQHSRPQATGYACVQARCHSDVSSFAGSAPARRAASQREKVILHGATGFNAAGLVVVLFRGRKGAVCKEPRGDTDMVWIFERHAIAVGPFRAAWSRLKQRLCSRPVQRRRGASAETFLVF